MTKKELVEKLEGFDDHVDVYFSIQMPIGEDLVKVSQVIGKSFVNSSYAGKDFFKANIAILS